MPENVVDLLTRYPVRTRFDAQENRMTAAVAAALSQSDGLAGKLVAQLAERLIDGGLPTRGPFKVVTQRAVVRPGQAPWLVDLEIVGAGGRMTIWLEAKIASGLSGPDQLTKYADALRSDKSAVHTLLVLLGPAWRREELERHLRPDLGVPAVFASWADIHRVLEEWEPKSADDRRKHWFVEQVRSYMAEQGHESPKALSKAHAAALDRLEEATAAVWYLYEQTAAKIDKEWTRVGPKQRASGQRRWQGWGESQYRLERGGGARQTRGKLAFGFEAPPLKFYAGMYFQRSINEALKAKVKAYADADADWHCDLDSAVPCLWKELPVRGLVDRQSTGAQVRALSAFVRKSFKELERFAANA
jgi:hypothetical protein